MGSGKTSLLTAGGGALKLRTVRNVIRCLHLPAVGKGLCLFLTLRAILAYQILDKRRLPPAAAACAASRPQSEFLGLVLPLVVLELS